MKVKYTKEQLQKAVDSSLNKAEVLRSLGLSPRGGNYKTLAKYLDQWFIDISHFTGRAWNQGKRYRPIVSPISLESILVENSTYTSTTGLKKKLFNEGYKTKMCEICELTHWLGTEIPLELHHVNGVSSDHRIHNLQIVCPNCHALTDNYRGKNCKRKKQPKSKGSDKSKSISHTVKNTPKKRGRKRNNACLVCGDPAVNKYCSYRCTRSVRSKNIPSEEVLIQDKRLLKTYVAIATKYNVSDNAVKKWFKKYELI